MHVRRIALIGFLGAVMSAPSIPANAASCADLWYKRNEIFAQNGYCFKTKLARNTFRHFDCWTKKPKLSRYERETVAAIKREERRRGCKVN